MEPNKSIVIDFQPSNLLCNEWAQNFAQRNYITYYSFFTKAEFCECSQFDCYPSEPIQEADFQFEKNQILQFFQAIIDRND